MDIQQITQLVNLVENSHVHEVLVQDGSTSMRVKNSPKTAQNFSQPSAMPLNAIPNGSENNCPQAITASTNPEVNTIKSQHIGWVQLGADAISEPYVSVGSQVQQGDTVAMVAMLGKLEAVVSDKAGTVTAVLVNENQGVDYGTALFELQ